MNAALDKAAGRTGILVKVTAHTAKHTYDGLMTQDPEVVIGGAGGRQVVEEHDAGRV